MSDTTNILDLPTDPAGGGNITITSSEIKQPSQNGGAGISLDQTTISQIVNGLQQASITGSTQLPSRDISMNTNTLFDHPIMPGYGQAAVHTLLGQKTDLIHADTIDQLFSQLEPGTIIPSKLQDYAR